MLSTKSKRRVNGPVFYARKIAKFRKKKNFLTHSHFSIFQSTRGVRVVQAPETFLKKALRNAVFLVRFPLHRGGTSGVRAVQAPKTFLKKSLRNAVFLVRFHLQCGHHVSFM